MPMMKEIVIIDQLNLEFVCILNLCMPMMKKQVIVGSDLREAYRSYPEVLQGFFAGVAAKKEHVSCLNLCHMKICMQGLEFTARV